MLLEGNPYEFRGSTETTHYYLHQPHSTRSRLQRQTVDTQLSWGKRKLQSLVHADGVPDTSLKPNRHCTWAQHRMMGMPLSLAMLSTALSAHSTHTQRWENDENDTFKEVTSYGSRKVHFDTHLVRSGGGAVRESTFPARDRQEGEESSGGGTRKLQGGSGKRRERERKKKTLITAESVARNKRQEKCLGIKRHQHHRSVLLSI